MKKSTLFTIVFIGSLLVMACNNKKLTEVVEVPLPASDDKITIGLPEDARADAGAFSLVKLPNTYDAFGPSIGTLAMENHYSKHYLTYTNNLNKLIAADQALVDVSIEDILKKVDMNNADLKNNAGGYYNHTLFFENLAPVSKVLPKDTLAAAINRDFGSFTLFKTMFTDAAENQFGSGWAWLVVDKTGKLQITSTSNQENPLMPKQVITGTPILNIDVWEHAYYLDYQYKRKRYIDNYFNIINWKKVNERYLEALKNKKP
ncbi:superoxide dismutase [Flavobacterium sp.]